MKPPRFARLVPTLATPISRRRLLPALVPLAGQTVPAVVAAPGTPAPCSTALPPVVLAWFGAWGAADAPRAVAALYTPDGSHDDVPALTSADGSTAIAAAVRAWLTGVADLNRYPRGAFGAGAFAAVEQAVWGTNRGFFPGARAGFQVYVVTVFELKGDRIHRSADYYDRATILTQLGAGPAPGTPTGG